MSLTSINSSNAEASFVQSTRTQNYLKTIITLSCRLVFVGKPLLCTLIWVFAYFCIGQPLCCWWLSGPIQNNAKLLKNHWNPGTWWYSPVSTPWGLSHEYQHDRVLMVLKNRCIPVKSPVFNRSLLFFGLHFTCLLFFSCFFLVSCFSPVFLENQSKATIISCLSSSSAQIYLNSYSIACNSALLACLNNTQLT